MNGSATVIDNTGRFAGSTTQVAADAVAGLNAWSNYLVGDVGSIEIQVNIVDSTTTDYASGGSGGLYYTSTDNGLRITEPEAAIELRTGLDANGARPDIVINVNVDALSSGGTMWINPLTGAGPPAGKVNLVSILAHEIGHGLGFTGERDEATYALPNTTDEGVFDSYVSIIGGLPYFTGPNAEAAYGGPVPLMAGNLYHLGDPTGPGSNLTSDLMYFQAHAGTTPVSALDAQVLSDLGVPTVFADLLYGFDSADTMDAGAGADTVFAGGGNDSVLGGDGDDYLRGEDGADQINGGSGFDDINGNAGNDTLFGGLGPDWVVGGKDDDLLSGDDGDDIVYGNLGNDWCDGGPGNDLIRGGQGDDHLLGQAGNDWMSGDRGADTLTGGPGADTFHTFAQAGIDLVTDFNQAEGDRVQVDVGTAYTLRQSGADTVIDMGGGNQMILAGVSMANLTPGWIFAL